MKLVVGLGNPGTKYRSTRHNVGFQCVDMMARLWEIPTNERRAKAVLGIGRHAGQDVVLVKPRTFMNNSGEAIEYLLARFGCGIQNLLVIYDEMEIPLGRLRIRASGSSGGHNGMRSIISTVHTEDFQRIRLGIGPPPGGGSSIPYLLGPFTSEEQVIVSQATENVAAAVECVLEEDINAAMNRFNRQMIDQ